MVTPVTVLVLYDLNRDCDATGAVQHDNPRSFFFVIRRNQYE